MFRLSALALSLCVALASTPARAQMRTVNITIDRRDSIALFDPVTALGSTIDGHVNGATRLIFTRANVAAMKSANFHPISYRTRTELGMEVWHWNPRGRWSDAANRRGYWTSDDKPGSPIDVSYGYNLPRRGNTIGQAHDEGYSRLTDGDTATFWKSNPYLDPAFTHEPEAAHPQWVLLDLGRSEDVSAIFIRWGVPYATRYDVQYWPGEQPRGPDDNVESEGWRTFDNGSVSGGASAAGGHVRISLARIPARTRWVRILLRASSHTAPRRAHDPRDAMGFAIREIALYRRSSAGLHEITRHGTTAASQTHTYASSTDPWHRATDRDGNTEQPGIDLVFGSGVTRGLPMLVPVGVLYDIPANGAALLRYLRARRYPVNRLELGEEPDGQFVSPDDFAALYIQAADSLRAVDASITLGGPSFQDARTKVMMAWKDGTADVRSWFAHFLAAMRARGRERQLGFVSFEFYPFDDACNGTATQLAQVAQKIRSAVRQFRSDGAPADLPLLMTEYGYSPFSTESEMNRAGAILNAEAVAEFLAEGGAEAYFYGTEPSTLDRNENCDSWGDNTLFVADDDRRIIARNSTFHGARMLTTLWADSAGGTHTMLRTRVASRDNVTSVGAYSLRRPDRSIALLLLNRDPVNTIVAHVDGLGRGRVDLWRFSSAEYVWHPDGEHGSARPNSGPEHSETDAGAPVLLPPYSITVIRER